MTTPALTRAKESLRENEDRFRLIIDTIPTMAWTLRPDGTVDFVNTRWQSYMGLSLEDELKKPTGVVHPDDLPRVLKRWLPDMATGEPFEDEMRLRRADGEYRWFLVRTVPLHDHRRRIVKWFGTCTEIEDRKRAEVALKRSLDELHALAGRLQSIREEERTRVAREIHDELGQALAAIKLESASLIRGLPVNAKQQLNLAQSIVKLVDGTIETVQRIATELRPAILDHVGLMAAVEWTASEFQSRTGTECRLDLPRHDIVIDVERTTALFRILQETLTNVTRHAKATHVTVRLAKEGGSLILEVHDNGKGISQERLLPGRSLGILGMRERAWILGGDLDINSTLGTGTTITVRIPHKKTK